MIGLYSDSLIVSFVLACIFSAAVPGADILNPVDARDPGGLGN